MAAAVDTWIVNNVDNALGWANAWGEKIYGLLLKSPEDFNGSFNADESGDIIWKAVIEANKYLQIFGFALLTVFFVYGLVQTCASYTELKKPEKIFKHCVRFAIVKYAIQFNSIFILKAINIVQNILFAFNSKVNNDNKTFSLFAAAEGTTVAQGYDYIPATIVQALDESKGIKDTLVKALISIATLLGSWAIYIMCIVMLLTVFGRFFKLYMQITIAPLPLATFGAQETSKFGKNFVKSVIATTLEVFVMFIAFWVFSKLSLSFGTSAKLADVGGLTVVTEYLVKVLLSMLLLVSTVKASDRFVNELFGLGG